MVGFLWGMVVLRMHDVAELDIVHPKISMKKLPNPRPSESFMLCFEVRQKRTSTL